MGLFRNREMRAHVGFKQVNQVRIIVGKVVWNAETDDLFLTQGLRKFVPEIVPMLGFHDENQVGPSNQAFGNPLPGSGFRPSRFWQVAGKIPVKLFSCTAAPFVPATDEEKVDGGDVLGVRQVTSPQAEAQQDRPPANLPLLPRSPSARRGKGTAG